MDAKSVLWSVVASTRTGCPSGGVYRNPAPSGMRNVESPICSTTKAACPSVGGSDPNGAVAVRHTHVRRRPRRPLSTVTPTTSATTSPPVPAPSSTPMSALMPTRAPGPPPDTRQVGREDQTRAMRVTASSRRGGGGGEGGGHPARGGGGGAGGGG